MPSNAKITTDLQIERLKALGTSRAGPLYLLMVKLGARVQTRAARNLSGRMVRVRTGNLRSSGSTQTEIRGSKLVESVIFDAEYAAAVHDGQRPHDIAPVRAKVLAWQPSGGGPTRFAMKVHHPGTKARPFLSEALDEVRNP